MLFFQSAIAYWIGSVCKRNFICTGKHREVHLAGFTVMLLDGGGLEQSPCHLCHVLHSVPRMSVTQSQPRSYSQLSHSLLPAGSGSTGAPSVIVSLYGRVPATLEFGTWEGPWDRPS